MGHALCSGISFCLIGEQPVFLDLPRDRYFGLTDESGRCFARLVRRAAPGPDDDRLIAALVMGGVLVPGGADEVPIACPAVPIGRGVLDDGVPAAWTLAASLRALGATTRAHLALRWRSLASVLAALAARKAALGAGLPPPKATLERIASAFETSALAVSSLDACLPRSLALADWLIGLGHPATLVIGVKLRPFQAHCWVQHADQPVSDSADRVRSFTPILVV